jgi:putative ABC transport system ATP-binding protein
MTEALYEIRDLSRIYRMGEVEVSALVGANLEIREGELLVILGPSGSGKSTLLNLLGGMDVPTGGAIRFRGRDLGDTGNGRSSLTAFRRRHVGFVFQFYNLMPSLTAIENVEMATELAEDPHDPLEMLRLVDLEQRANHFPAQLSGGEQQRVAIARAVAKNPEVLLCDEPTGALDYRTGKLVLEMIQRVNQEMGTTVLLITHNAAIGAMGHRVVRMGSGRIVDITINEKPLTPGDIEW